MGAVGINHLVAVSNGSVRITDRNGNQIGNVVSLDSFWQQFGGSFSSANAFDPKILFDPYGQRFFFTACANAASANSAQLFAVSASSDPTGTWHALYLDADSTDALWADYPSIGFNQHWIAVNLNMFPLSTGTSKGRLYVIPRLAAYGGDFDNVQVLEPADSFTLVPAFTYDPSEAALHLVKEWNGNSGGTGFLRLGKLTGPINSATFDWIDFVSSPEPWAGSKTTTPTSRDGNGPQLGSSRGISTNDSRMQNVVFRNGSVWCTHTVHLPAADPTRASVQWWQMSTAGSVLQRARIDDPSGQMFFIFPTLSVNASNDMLIGYSRLSPNQYASANYSFRLGTDAPNTLQADTVLKPGEGPYEKTFGSTRNRWGDYSATMVDPVNDVDMWTIQEYAGLPSGTGDGAGRWALWWGKISPAVLPPGPEINVEQPPGTVLTDALGTQDFGGVAPGGQRTLTFTVRNAGNIDLTDLSLSKDGSHSADFTMGALGASTLAPAASTTFSVTFSPSALGVRTAAIHLASNDADENPFDIALAGNGELSANFSNTAAISIPDSGQAAPYPSTISVVGLTGTVSKTIVKLNSFTHTYPADVDVLLVGPGGQNVLLMSDAGGSTDVSGIHLQFDDAAAAALTEPLTSGTFLPTNVGTTLDNFPTPAPAGPYGSSLAVFNDLNPNGTWSLYVVDDAGSDVGTLGGGWELTFMMNIPAVPEIVVEQPEGTGLADGVGSRDFGPVPVGTQRNLTFTLRNIGTGDLTGLSIVKDGTHNDDFGVGAPDVATLGPGAKTTFTVTFIPAATGPRSAGLHIGSNDADENPFDITIGGRGLSPNEDTDTDGLNDVAELQWAALGFDWQISQPDLVNTLYTHANLAALYTESQVQALHLDTPLISRDAATGRFRLTIGVKKSTDLLQFLPFPFTDPGTNLNAAGQIEFEFSVPDNAAFFLLQAE